MGLDMPMKQLTRIGVAMASGGLAVLAFPPFGWWPLALVAWVVCFAAVWGSGFRWGFRLGFLHGVALYAGSLCWFWNIFAGFSVALWLLLSLFTGLACGLAGWASRKWAGAWWLPVYAAVVWSGIEYFRCEWFWLRFPWITPGVALGPTWVSPLIGVYGAGFLLMLSSALCVSGTRRVRLGGAMLAACLLGLGLFRPPPVMESGPGVPVLAVQSENCDLRTYLEAAKREATGPCLIVWPEYSVPYPVRRFRDDMRKIVALARDKDSVLVFGTQKDSGNGRHYNEALTLDASGELGSHFKNRPVHFMDDGEPGSVAVPVATKFGLIGTPVCFDSDYTEVARRMTAAGAEVLVAPTMDAEPWTARQHLQHSELFRLRAIENGRWLVTATTSGLTQFIDPHGNRISQLPMACDGVLRGNVYLHRERTFFTEYGWMFPWAILSAAGVWTAALAIAALRCPCKSHQGGGPSA